MGGEADDLRCAAAAGCRLTGLLGRSRHARVHGAERGGGPVVLKVCAADDPVARTRFAREGRLGLSLRHPGLVETLDCGTGWILLGDLRGPDGQPAPDLHGRVATDPAEAAGGLGAVAAALAHLHGRGLVHRDVKPGNVLAGPGGPVLIDLGLVGLAAGDDLGADEIVGAPAWMAPEQVRGARPRPSADVWSFALLLAYALCGIPAYAGSAEAVLDQRRAGAGPSPEFTGRLAALADPALRDLIGAGLSADPSARPPVETFARRLAAGPARP